MLSWIYNRFWPTKPSVQDDRQPIGKISPYHPMHLLHAQMVMKTPPMLYAYRDCFNDDESQYYQQSGYEFKLPVRRHKWTPKARRFARGGDFFHGYIFRIHYDNVVDMKTKKLKSEAERTISHTEFSRKKISKGQYLGKSTHYSIDNPSDDVEPTLFYLSRSSGEHVVTQTYHFYT